MKHRLLVAIVTLLALPAWADEDCSINIQHDVTVTSESLLVSKQDKELYEIVQEGYLSVAGEDVELTDETEVVNSFTTHVARLKELVKKTERQIKEYERQLSMVKTTESVQKASAAITDNFSSSNSRILSAKDSLERIKKRQQDNFDKMSAAEALMEEDSDKGLEDRMKAAGIGEQKTSANSVLDRIKANKSA